MNLKSKRIVVTGGCGMVGRELVAQLREKGANVRVLDDLSAPNSDSSIPHIKIDVRNANSGFYMFDGEPADAVFNLAARVGGVFFNMANNFGMFRENTEIAASVLGDCQEAGVENFLQVSSVCIYARYYNNPAQEKFGMHGSPEEANEGYAWAKRMCEKLAMWSDIERVMVVRPTNVFGIGDNFGEHSHVIPSIINKFRDASESVELRSSGEEIREFIYAPDAAAGMIAVMENGHDREVYNLGNANGRESILDLSTLIRAFMELENILISVGDRAYGDLARSTDCSLVEEHCGWKAQTSLIDGLQDVIDSL